jgi:hypothetical protein
MSASLDVSEYSKEDKVAKRIDGNRAGCSDACLWQGNLQATPSRQSIEIRVQMATLSFFIRTLLMSLTAKSVSRRTLLLIQCRTLPNPPCPPKACALNLLRRPSASTASARTLSFRSIVASLCDSRRIIAGQSYRASSQFVVQSKTSMGSGTGQTVQKYDA